MSRNRTSVHIPINVRFYVVLSALQFLKVTTRLPLLFSFYEPLEKQNYVFFVTMFQNHSFTTEIKLQKVSIQFQNFETTQC